MWFDILQLELPVRVLFASSLIMFSLAACAHGNEPTQPGQATMAIEMWIVLSEPVASEALDATEKKRQMQHLEAQQEETIRRLQTLGIDVIVRVRHVRNALLARLTPAQADTVRKLPGVLGVHPAQSMHPPVIDDHQAPPAASTGLDLQR
jgi:hypothetical protein